MIYLDTSVALAHLLAEDHAPPARIWQETLISSRLLEYEIWTRIHALEMGDSHGAAVRDLLARVAIVELAPPVLTRALEPWPAPLRTLDALHLATIAFLLERRQQVSLATLDRRMLNIAGTLGIPIWS